MTRRSQHGNASSRTFWAERTCLISLRIKEVDTGGRTVKAGEEVREEEGQVTWGLQAKERHLGSHF